MEKKMKNKEKEKKKRRGRRTKNGEGDTRNASPSPGTFPSTKLGNNMTLIKGRLGKKHNSHKQKSNRTEPESSG